MKKVQYILGMIVCCIIMLLSCSKSNDVSSSALLPELVQAEEIMYESPDSALHILQTMPIPQPSDKLQYATWALFVTQAKYKLSLNQSDSLLNVAASYFNKSKMSQRRALVLYHQAGLKKEKKEYEKAQNLLLEATTEVEKTDDYQLAHLVYASLGGIYVYRSLLEYSLSAYNKAYDYALKSADQKHVIASLVYLGRTYGVLRDVPKSIDYYKQAANLAKETPYHEIEISTLNELASIYNKGKDFQSALMYMNEVLELCSKYSIEVSPQDYVVLGEIYKSLNKTDSAEFYLKKALSTSNIYTRRGACLDLFYLYKKNGNFKDAALFLEQSWKLHDSIQKLDKSKVLIEMQEKYNQQKIINEKNEIELEKNNVICRVLICLIISLVAIVVLSYFYQKKLLEKERKIQDAEEMIRNKTIQIQENEQIINKNQKRINDLYDLINKNKDVHEQMEEQSKLLLQIQNYNIVLKNENQVLLKDINKISSTLKEKSKELTKLEILSEENMQLHDRERFLSAQLVMKNNLFNSLKDKPKYIELYQWREIIENIDMIYDSYTKRLSKLIPTLTESDIQVCCLIKLKLSNPTIGTLLAISPASVSKRKMRLKERIIQVIGAFNDCQTLDLWLWEF